MRRLILISCSVLLVAAAGCGEPGETGNDTQQGFNIEEGGGDDDNDEEENGEYLNHNENQPNGDNDNDDDPRSIASLAAEATAGGFATMLRQFEYRCRCHYEMMDFDSEDKCLEESTASDQEVEEARDCIETSIQEYGEPAPDGVWDFFECMEAEAQEAAGCYDDVQQQYGDTCSQEAEQAHRDCADAFGAGMNLCEDLIDDESDQWLDAVEPYIEQNGCMDDLEPDGDTGSPPEPPGGG